MTERERGLLYLLGEIAGGTDRGHDICEETFGDCFPRLAESVLFFVTDPASPGYQNFPEWDVALALAEFRPGVFDRWLRMLASHEDPHGRFPFAGIKSSAQFFTGLHNTRRGEPDPALVARIQREIAAAEVEKRAAVRD